MAVRRRGEGFQADFTVAGVRYRAQFDSLSEAELWEAEVRLAIKKGLPAPQPNGTASTAEAQRYATLGAVFNYTRDHVWADAKASRDLVRNAKAVVDHFGPECAVKSIGRSEIDDFILSLKARRNSGGTINRKLAALSRMLRTAVELGALASKPVIPRQKESEGRERYLERAEADAIVATLRLWSKHDEADLVEFLLATGCRVGEALSLEWKDIHPGYITVVGDKAKTSRTRHVPIPGTVAEMVGARRFAEPVAKGPFTGITYGQFRHAFERAVDHLGLEDVVIHTLRHTTLSWLAISGVDIRRIMEFAGHSEIKTTMRYAKLSPRALDGLAGVIAGYGQRQGEDAELYAVGIKKRVA